MLAWVKNKKFWSCCLLGFILFGVFPGLNFYCRLYLINYFSPVPTYQVRWLGSPPSVYEIIFSGFWEWDVQTWAVVGSILLSYCILKLKIYSFVTVFVFTVAWLALNIILRELNQMEGTIQAMLVVLYSLVAGIIISGISLVINLTSPATE
jgi:hypothetical protein